MSIKRINQIFFRVFILVVLLTACSTRVDMKVSSLSNGDVVFSFYKSKSNQLEKNAIYNLYVQKEDKSLGWVTIWDIEGGGKSLSNVVYGVLPTGFKQITPSVELEPHNHYRALVRFRMSTGSGVAVCQFSISADGSVVDEKC